MKLTNKELLYDILWMLAGNITLAMGVAWFILPNDVLTGGLAGVAVALEPIIHVNPEMFINVMTVVLFLVGAPILGKKFATKTIFCTICYPVMLSLMTFKASARATSIPAKTPSAYSSVPLFISLDISLAVSIISTFFS